MEFGIFRYFIGLIDAREILDLTGQRAAIQALRIARDTLVDWRIDEDFDEFIAVEQFSHHAALSLEG